MNNNPPQLQLSLGHQTFKRSFTQFGLDVDDTEDSRSEGGSASSASSSSASSSRSGSARASNGSRSTSSGSSYSSQSGGSDAFGCNDGERNERNKRARSEGPERETSSATSSAPSNAESVESAGFLSLPTSSGSGSVLDVMSAGVQPMHQAASSNTDVSHQSDSSYTPSTSPAFTLPVLDFGSSSRSITEFINLRSSTSTTWPSENLPGFADMLSPRSSSPAPPPAVEVDVTMLDDEGDGDGSDESEDPLSSLGSHSGRQDSSASALNSAFLDTARSDALLNSATERLQSTMERARTFDRLLAPLRSDANDGAVGAGPGAAASSRSSTAQVYTRPRLPPFDFEARRRQSPLPLRTNSGPEISNSFDWLQRSPDSANSHSSTMFGTDTSSGPGSSTNGRLTLAPIRGALHFPTAFGDRNDEDIESEDEDDLAVDRELTVEPDQNNNQGVTAADSVSSSGSESRPLMHRRTAISNINADVEDPLRTTEGREDVIDMFESLDSIGRNVDGGIGGMLESARDIVSDPGMDFYGASRQLDSRLSAEESNVGGSSSVNSDSNRPITRLQMAISSSQTPAASRSRYATSSRSVADGISSSAYGLEQPASRSGPRPNTSWNQGRDMNESVSTGSYWNDNRFRGWPWDGLLNSPSFDIPNNPQVGSSTVNIQRQAQSQSQSQSQTNSAQQQQQQGSTSPRLQLHTQSPLFPFPSSSDPNTNPVANPEMETADGVRRMTEMEADSLDRFLASLRSHSSPGRPSPARERENDPIVARLRSIGGSGGAGPQRTSPTPRPVARPATARRPNLPTLRSAILDPLMHEVGGDYWSPLLRRVRASADGSVSAASGTASGTSGASSSVSGLDLRSRASHSDSGSTRPTLVSPESQFLDVIARRQRERDLLASLSGRFGDEGEVASLPIDYEARTGSRPSTRPLENVPVTRSPEQSSPSHLRARDYAREALERRRQHLQHRVLAPSISEAARLSDAQQTQTRLRMMREQYRLSVPPRSAQGNRQGRTAPSDPNAMPRHDFVLRWADNWRAPGDADLLRTENDDLFELNIEPGNGLVRDAAPSSSTEAAAFASGLPYDTVSRQHSVSQQHSGRPSASELRQRRSWFSLDLDDEMRSIVRDDPWDNFEMNMDPVDTYGFERESQRRTNATTTNHFVSGFRSPRTDLIQLVSARRGLHEEVAQRQTTLERTNLATEEQFSSDSEFDDLPPLEEVRPRTFPNFRRRPPQESNSIGRAGRSVSLRSASRPPSLPPLQFERLSSATPEGIEGQEGRLFGLQEPGSNAGTGMGTNPTRTSPWRRLSTRFDEDSEFHPTNLTSRNAFDRSRDLALHHAMVLRSVQARQAAIERQRSGTAAPRPPGFQHAMDVLGADGLSTSLQHQFTAAFERERSQDRTRSTRNEAHVRWGEIPDDEDEARTSSHAPRPGSDPLRARRRSTSALFAPPPENADTLPPNRARGLGTAGGDPNAQPQHSQPDWFTMFSTSRARARNRVRIGRTDEEPTSRLFSRFGRNNRNGLRNLGDFVRDEEFDTSYESLLALAASIGEAKPRSTPAHVISALPTGLYKDWRGPGCDIRCPICLDDYKDVDPLLKAEPCNHWCHKECLEQWFHTASTCPVCRTKIKPSQRVPTPPPVAGPSRSNRTSINDVVDDSDDELSFVPNWITHDARAR